MTSFQNSLYFKQHTFFPIVFSHNSHCGRPISLYCLTVCCVYLPIVCVYTCVFDCVFVLLVFHGFFPQCLLIWVCIASPSCPQTLPLVNWLALCNHLYKEVLVLPPKRNIENFVTRLNDSSLVSGTLLMCPKHAHIRNPQNNHAFIMKCYISVALIYYAKVNILALKQSNMFLILQTLNPQLKLLVFF